MKGFFNKILIIDVTEKTTKTEEITDRVYERYLGGKGLGAYLMHKLNKQGIDPLSPDNHLIITTGPVNDTGIWGSSRYAVITKSPQTGFFSHSYSGGNVAEYIGRTGYDAVVIKGKSPEPVYLEINDKTVVFHNAEKLWGTDTYNAESYIRDELKRKDMGILVIGPAGERLVYFANMVNNKWRCAGRTGVGAVMGSKNIKAVVFYGNEKRQVAHPHETLRFHNEWKKRVNDYPSSHSYKRIGTPGLVSIINHLEAFPSRYWYDGSLDGWEAISGETLHSDFSVKPKACYMCLLACSRYTEVRQGRYKGLRIEGPEYETIFAFGGLCLIKNLEDIIFINDLCDRLGIDTISAGNLCAFAIEASKRGRIKERLEYGDTERIIKLLQDIGACQGIGGVLAKGIAHAAKEWDMEDIAIHVKGMDLPGYDPRYFKGMGLAYATSDRGACHLRSTFFRAEASGMIPPDAVEGKARLFIDFEDRLNLHDCLIVCRFYRDLYGWDELSRIIRITTGMDLDKQGLMEIASHVQDATRLFNIREGMTRKDDSLPKRFFRESIGSGKAIISQEELEYMKDDYYSLRGWDSQGKPFGTIE